MLFEVQESVDVSGAPYGWALWQMVEPEELLRSLCPPDCPPCTFSNEARRKEYYAVRAMLAAVLGKDKRIDYLPSGQPFLSDNSYYISISHTKGFCALAWHAFHPVGVDVEQIADRVSRVAHRFVSPDEQSQLEKYFADDIIRGQLLLWSAKEAAYKLVNRPATDFLRDIIVDFDAMDAENGTCLVNCRTAASDNGSSEVVHPMRFRFFQSFVFVIVGLDD